MKLTLKLFTLLTGITINTLTLAMRLKVTRNVGCTKKFATYITRHLSFMAHHVCPQSVFGGKGSSTGLAFEGSFGRMHMLHMAA